MSSSCLPRPTTELIEKSTIDWKSLEICIAFEEEEVDRETLKLSLDARIRTSPCPVQEAINLFCFLPVREIMISVFSFLRGEIVKRLTSESLVKLLRGVYRRHQSMSMFFDRRRFLLACQPLLDKDFAREFFEKFKVVALEIVRLLDIKGEGDLFLLRVLDIKVEMVNLHLPDNVDWASLLGAGSGAETDENGNTCINVLLANISESKYPVTDIRTIIETFPDALGIPNHQSTLPAHNLFVLSRMPRPYTSFDVLWFTLETFSDLVDSSPNAILSPSPELHGRTPFHTILPEGLRITDIHVCLSHRPGYRQVQVSMATEATEKFVDRVETVLRIYPNSRYLVDDDGFTPLHYVISRAYVHLDLQKKEPLVIRLLSSLVSPRAARIASNKGKLPLHTALEHSFDFVDELCAAAPETVARRDPDTFLYPFQMTYSKFASSVEGLQRSYALLRMVPQLVATGLTDEATAYLSTKEQIEAAKLGLEAERMRVHHHRYRFVERRHR